LICIEATVNLESQKEMNQKCCGNGSMVSAAANSMKLMDAGERFANLTLLE
jgi:hypothetical protein